VFVWVLRVAVVAAFNIGNRTENGAYSVLAVFGQAKETTTLPHDLWAGVGWVKLGDYYSCCCCSLFGGGLLLPRFIVFVVLPSG